MNEEDDEPVEKKARKEEKMDIVVGTRRRGKKHSLADPKLVLVLDVTSGSANAMTRTLSPLYLEVAMDDKGLVRGSQKMKLEHAWQLLKVYPQLGHWDEQKKQLTAVFWRDFQTGYTLRDRKRADKGVRRPPRVQRLARDQRKPLGHWWPAEQRLLSLKEARAKIYEPLYREAVLASSAWPQVLALVRGDKKGRRTVMIKDVDGPNVERWPAGRAMCDALMAEVRSDEQAPLGHGYVFANLLQETLASK